MMAATSELAQQPKAEAAADQRHRLSPGGAGGSCDDTSADSISLRPSWGRAVTRPCATNLLPTTSNGHHQSAPEQQPTTSVAQKRTASETAGKPNVFGVITHQSMPTSPATALDSLTGGSWLQTAAAQGLSTPTATAYLSAATPAVKDVSGLGSRDGSGIGQQLFGAPAFLQPMRSVGGRSFGSDNGGGGGATAAAHGLSSGSPMDSGRGSPAHNELGGGAGGGGSDGGDGAASFLSYSPDASPTAIGAPPLSPFRCRTSIGGGLVMTATPGDGGSGGLVSAPALPKSEPLLGPSLSHSGSQGSHGSQGGGGGDGGGGGAAGAAVGLGPGQVYLVVDPSTGLVVGTAQATGASTPGSMAPSTPSAGGMTFHGTGGGGHTPAGTGSARSSLDLPRNPLAGGGPSGPGPAGVSQLRNTSSQVRTGGGQGGPMGAADMTRAALSLLGGSAAGGGSSMPSRASASAAAAAAAASAAAVSQQNALALASLAAAADSAGRAAGGGPSGGEGGAAAQQSTAELLMLLASAGAQSAAGGGGLGGGGGGGAMTTDTSAAAALASTLDPATAAALLDEGLATGGLTDDVIVALAQAAGVLDAASGAAGAGAQSAAAGASGAGAMHLPLPVPFPSGAGVTTAVGAAGPTIPAPPGFTSALLGPAGPAVFAPGAAVGPQQGAAGLPNFSSSAGGVGNAATVAAVRAGLLGNGSLAGLAGLASPGAGSWRSPSWRNTAALGGLGGLGSPGAAAVAAGARTTQAAAALAPQGLLAGLASPPGPRGTGPKHNTLYKTEMCRSWTETGSCRYGSKCQFAHGPEELRPVIRHPKYKTEHCRTYAATGACQYGNRCRFIHAAPPGSAIGTPRPQGVGLLGPEAGDDGLMAGDSPAGGVSGGRGAALQSAAAAVGASVWSRTAESTAGNGALPAAAASLLSPVKACLFSPTGRGAARHSNSLSSPPFKMARLTEQLLPLMHLPATNGTAGGAGGEAAAANRAVSASLALLGGGGGGGAGAGGGMFGGGAEPASATDAALQLFSAFGRGGDVKSTGVQGVPPLPRHMDQQQQQHQACGPLGRQEAVGAAAQRHGNLDTVMESPEGI